MQDSPSSPVSVLMSCIFMNTTSETARSSYDPQVPCPVELKSPFLNAAQILSSGYGQDELAKILCQIDALIDQKEISKLRTARRMFWFKK